LPGSAQQRLPTSNPSKGRYPLALGIASGHSIPNTLVLWNRFARQPLLLRCICAQRVAITPERLRADLRGVSSVKVPKAISDNKTTASLVFSPAFFVASARTENDDALTATSRRRPKIPRHAAFLFPAIA
jgi:hypothetical protein